MAPLVLSFFNLVRELGQKNLRTSMGLQKPYRDPFGDYFDPLGSAVTVVASGVFGHVGHGASRVMDEVVALCGAVEVLTAIFKIR